MLCTMCPNVNVRDLWVCGCGQRHCKHIHKCPCGITRRSLTLRGLPDGFGPTEPGTKVLCGGFGGQYEISTFRVVGDATGAYRLELYTGGGWIGTGADMLPDVLRMVFQAGQGSLLEGELHDAGQSVGRRRSHARPKN